MKIEQYLCGRKRYNGYPIGNNGDISAGFGCYCRTDDVLPQDMKDLSRYFEYYVCNETKSDGSKPTILSKTNLQSGNMALTAQTAIRTEGDRANVTSHSYIIPAGHSQSVEPETWFSLPYYRHDLNAATPQEEAVRQAADEQLTLVATNLLPQSQFILKPLKEVMKIWKLSMETLLGLIEGVIDASRLANHEVFLVYDINNTTEDDMQQLLAWLYLMLPYSFRRVVGYDTLHNGTSYAHQIVFVATQQLIQGRELRIRSWESDGTQVREKKIFIERAYLYNGETGELTHNPASGEIFGKNTPFVRLLVNEIIGLAELDTIDDCRIIMGGFNAMFKSLDCDLQPYETSVEVYDTEIYFLNDMLTGSLKELNDAALNTLNDPELSRSPKLLHRLRMASNALETRKNEQDGTKYWNKFVQIALKVPEFEKQEIYVKKLAEILCTQPVGTRFDLMRNAQKDLENKTICQKRSSDLLLKEMLTFEEFRTEYLSRTFANAITWKQRIDTSREFLQYIAAIFVDEYDHFADLITEAAWHAGGMPQPSDIESLILLLNFKTVEENRQELTLEQMVVTALNEFDGYIRQTDACRTIEKKGIEELLSFYKRSQTTYFGGYAQILENFYDAVCQKWIPIAGNILVEKPRLIFELLNAPAYMHIQKDPSLDTMNAIKNAISVYTELSLFERFVNESQQYPHLEQETDELAADILRHIVKKAEDKAVSISTGQLAEAVYAGSILEHETSNSIELDSLFCAVKKRIDITLRYLKDYTESIQNIHILGLKDSYIEERSFQFAKELLQNAINNLPENPQRTVLDEFDNLAKLWNSVDREGVFLHWRKQLTERMDLYPTFEQFVAFMNTPDEMNAEILENYGFTRINTAISEVQSQLTLLEELDNCPVKYLIQMMDEAVSTPGVGKNRASSQIYEKLCERLLDDACRNDQDNQINSDWFTSQDISVLSKLAQCGENARAMAYLCSTYQNRKTDIANVDAKTMMLLVRFYINGKLDLKKDFRTVTFFLRYGNKKFIQYLVKLETPEWLSELRSYLQSNNRLIWLGQLDETIKMMRNAFSDEDYILMTKTFEADESKEEDKAEQWTLQSSRRGEISDKERGYTRESSRTRKTQETRSRSTKRSSENLLIRRDDDKKTTKRKRR